MRCWRRRWSNVNYWIINKCGFWFLVFCVFHYAKTKKIRTKISSSCYLIHGCSFTVIRKSIRRKVWVDNWRIDFHYEYYVMLKTMNIGILHTKVYNNEMNTGNSDHRYHRTNVLGKYCLSSLFFLLYWKNIVDWRHYIT